MIVELNPKTDFIVHLPYRMTLENIKLESHSDDTDLEDSLGWLYDNADSDECSRIFTAALILHQVIVPRPAFADCLDTAIIWERG